MNHDRSTHWCSSVLDGRVACSLRLSATICRIETFTPRHAVAGRSPTTGSTEHCQKSGLGPWSSCESLVGFCGHLRMLVEWWHRALFPDNSAFMAAACHAQHKLFQDSVIGTDCNSVHTLSVSLSSLCSVTSK
jgi:hypothetical protein